MEGGGREGGQSPRAKYEVSQRLTCLDPQPPHHTQDTGGGQIRKHMTQDTGHRTQDTVGVIYDTAIFYHYLIILAVSGRSAREIFFLGEDWQSKGCARSKVDRIWRT